MKTAKSMSIVMIALILMLMLCSFSYAENGSGPETLDIGGTFTVNGHASDFDQLSGSFALTGEKQYILTIPRNYKILIDGKIGSLENAEMISAYKELSVSVFEGSDIVYINTYPQKYDGVVLSSGYDSGKHTAALNISSIKMVFVFNDNDISTDVSSGDSIVFIADGCKIIEVLKK